MKYTRHLLTVLLTTAILPFSWAQGIIVNKKDGTQVIYHASEVESITTFDEADEPDEETKDIIIKIGEVQFKMIYVEGGTFMMGATPEQSEWATYDELPAHEVELSSYYISETEVTQDLWEEIVGSIYNYSGGPREGNYPVQNMILVGEEGSVRAFLKELNRRTNHQFSLPTEAQWEYAARGGQKSQGYRFAGCDDSTEVGWTYENSERQVHAVKQKTPNELGIYDMTGNVCEWCSDYYSDTYYGNSPKKDPQGPTEVSDRYVIRGGGFLYGSYSCRVSKRSSSTDNFTYADLGFRIVMKSEE